jgi:hypothetical protein
LEEIKQSGYHIVEVTSDIGDPSRSLQIALQNGVVINWDRDSYSVWAHGPRPSSEKVEAYIASRQGRRKPRGLVKIFFWTCLAVGAAVVVLLAWRAVAGALATTPGPAPWPAATAID